MSEDLNSKRNHRMLMRIGDVNLRYADQINITSDDYNTTATTYTLNYKANHVGNDDVNIGLVFDNGVVGCDKTTTNISGVDIPISTDGYVVKYIDYNGAILKTEYVLTGGTSTPPTTPSHDLLTFNSWNSNYDNITGDTNIGAIYDTTDGKTYCFITLTLKGGYQPSIYLNKTGTTDITIDWGDGEVSTTEATGEFSIQKPTPYLSGTTGLVDVVISIESTDFYGLGNPLENFPMVAYYESRFKKCYIGQNVNKIDDYSFSNVISLRHVVVPNNIISVGTRAFEYCGTLTNVNLPNTITTIGDYCFSYCYILEYVNIPTNVEVINRGIFAGCFYLPIIYIPSNITHFIKESLSTLPRCEIILTNPTPPTIEPSSFGGGINLMIYVPDASLNAYRVASNWRAYAPSIYPISAKV